MDLAPPRVEPPPDARGRGRHRPDAALGGDEELLVRELFDRAGLDAGAYRRETLRRRFPACLRFLRAADAAEGRQRVRQQPRLAAAAVATMVIGVTSFFRDAAVFDHLTYAVLPALPRAIDHPRVWSIGCSDGAELYSVAILLAELGLLGGAFLLGTDCRTDGVARAREGRYGPRDVRDVPPLWLGRYFTREEEHDAWRVADPLRRAVQWRTADVTRVQEPGSWDLILCRNIAMYFRAEVAGRLWERLERALRPGGFLVLGKAERPLGCQRLASFAPCIYRRLPA